MTNNYSDYFIYLDYLMESSQKLLDSSTDTIPSQAAKAIIKYGQDSIGLYERKSIFRDRFQKAPGCTSEVELYAEFILENHSICIHGVSDSLFGKGFLGILFQSLSVRNSSKFICKDSFVEEYCNVPLIKYLPPARLIGIYELLKVAVQSLVFICLLIAII